MLVSSTHQSPSSSSDELAAQLHLTTFSIRDYAFSYRTKNVKKSWPFSSTSLQLCLKHGLSDLLPPIQSPKPFSLGKPGITISYMTKSEKLASNHKLVKTKEGFENDLASGSNSKIQVAITNKNPGKIVKPGACMDSGWKKDRSCLFATSESIMVSKRCPICKTFSSASNTTLNAHMDHCLSVDSGQPPIGKPSRPKVKSMIDIYAAAKECTLEDVDKRNGTQWAMVSTYSNKPEESNKGKKRSVLRVGVDEDASVYIDGKGQKLRILSEFNKKASSEDKESKKLIVSKGNASKIQEYQRGNTEEGKGKKRPETPDPGQCNQRMLKKGSLSRYKKQESGYSLSGGSSHVSADLSETLSSNSWRICGKEFASEAKLKKVLLDFSEGKWESEMTQECELTDNSYEETVNNKGDDEFESLIYEKTGCETVEQVSSFMEFDPVHIPGPPGSFLPSFWDMGTDAIGNSSVITSQVQSSQDQLDDLIDRNSSESLVSNIAVNNIDKRPSGLKDIGQSCCCQSKEKAFEDTQGKSVPVFRLMGKDLMVMNQREEEPSHDESTLKPTSHFLDLSKGQHYHKLLLTYP